MGTPRYQRQKLTESFRFKETKEFAQFHTKNVLAQTNEPQTKQKQNT